MSLEKWLNQFKKEEYLVDYEDTDHDEPRAIYITLTPDEFIKSKYSAQEYENYVDHDISYNIPINYE